MTDRDKFHNKDGSLTDYALACGYVEVITYPARVRPIEAEVCARLERHAGTRAYTVSTMGRYLRRFDYDGSSLTEARKVLRRVGRTLERDETAARAEYLRGAA